MTFSIRSLLHKRKQSNTEFQARMRMESNAQASIEARLTRLELVYKNKARLK